MLTVQSLLEITVLVIIAQISCEGRSQRKEATDNIFLIPEKIIGGIPADNGRFPYGQISLSISCCDHQCSASLIAPDVVLTAAHCAAKFDQIQVGRYNISDVSEEYDLFYPISIYKHPLFDNLTYRFDFAVVKMNGTNYSIDPIRLNLDNSNPATNDQLTTFGWGADDYTNPYDPIFPDVLQEAKIFALSNEQCQNSTVGGETKYEGQIYPEMICASAPQTDACLGDSGSPLIMTDGDGIDIQVGIVSWGTGCAIYPGVYSRVSYVYSWIRSQVCWLSADPPSYMHCGSFERNPEFFNTSAADMPSSIFPTDNPTVATSAISTSAQELVMVIVTIQLDRNSQDVGWYISDERGRVIVDFPRGTYVQPEMLVNTTILLEEDTYFIFTIRDERGDGICCDGGVHGWCRLSVFNTTGDLVSIVDGTGNFGYGNMIPFSTRNIQPPLIATQSPTWQTAVAAAQSSPKSPGETSATSYITSDYSLVGNIIIVSLLLFQSCC